MSIGSKNGQLNLSQGTIWKVLIAFVLPIIAGSLIQQLYTTVDAIIVGKFVGKIGLAAIDSVSTLFRFPINFLSGLSAGATIVVSAHYGAGDDDELDCCIHTAYTIAIFLGVGFSIIGFLFAPQLLTLMSVPDDIRSETLAYCRIYFLGLWTLTLYNMVAGLLRAFGNSKTPFYILIICCIVNIVGDLILVGVFSLGVRGAAYATIAAQLVSALLAMRSLAKTHGHYHHSVWEIRFCAEHMGEMLRKGLPLALQAILFPIANSIIQASINSMGTDAIAAWAVCAKLDLIIWLIADSMSPALSTYVAQNLGAGKPDRIVRGSVIGAAMSFGAVLVISACLFLAAGPLGSLFVSSSDAYAIVPLVVKYMRMMAPFYILYSFAESFSGACCGMGETLKSMIITLVCTCALRVACIFLVLPHFGTMECIIWIYIASWIAAGLTFLGFFIVKSGKLSTETNKNTNKKKDDYLVENIRNQDNIGSEELLTVSFGTSFNENRTRTICAIEESLQEAFPDMSVRRAFTSGMIIKHIYERDGVKIDNMADALNRAIASGVKNLTVQPTHLMNGHEYDKLMGFLKDVEASFDSIRVGEPLLMSDEDFSLTASAVISFLSSYDNSTTAFALMGHGTDAQSNAVYDRIQKEFIAQGKSNFFVGTVEAHPDVQDILAEIKKGSYTRIVMMPLMVVAGDHATNDMAGDEEDSWKSIFEAAGYETVAILQGLGQIKEIRDIYIKHAAAAANLTSLF